MPYRDIFYHIVIITKYREKRLNQPRLMALIQHIRTYASTKGIQIHAINGYQDHLHIFATIPVYIAVSDAIKAIKGESSRWINKNKLFEAPFRWQPGYYISTICPHHKKTVIRYILHQKEHHSLTPP